MTRKAARSLFVKVFILLSVLQSFMISQVFASSGSEIT